MKTIKVDGQDITPSKVVCIGRNYVAHIEELGNEIPEEMVIFNKPNCAITDILHSQIANEDLHYESELCFAVMGGEFHAVGFGLDLTKRGLQARLKGRYQPALTGVACRRQTAPNGRRGTDDVSPRCHS
jgi:2-keto-4-pentenoate hydratase/2-oxohepta-3-ene-1,7-dioic acid hydratase in catechol pathway